MIAEGEDQIARGHDGDLGLPADVGGAFLCVGVAVVGRDGVAADQLQRAVNLSLGSALSTIGLTVPVMLAISLFTGTPLKLGLNAVDIVLLSVTLFVCHITFSGAPTNILLGLVHLVLFGTCILLIFKP